MIMMGTSRVDQWLRVHASTSGDTGLIPGQGTKTLQASWCSQKGGGEKVVTNVPN